MNLIVCLSPLDLSENPGSDLSVHLGCTCPRKENDYGKGLVIGLRQTFVIDEKCPIHGTTENYFWK